MSSEPDRKPVPPSPPRRVRVLLVDDHEVVRVGMRTLLARFDALEVVGEARSVATAVAEASRLKPDVVLLDIRLPDGTGFDACRRIQELPGEIRVLFLSAFSSDEMILDAISAGADGYLMKEVDMPALARALGEVAAGRSVLDPTITKRVMERLRSGPEPDAARQKLALLSPQERRTMELVAEGKTNKEIAAVMGLSDKTVKNYLSNLLDKLELSRRGQAAAFYIQNTRK